MQNLIYNNEERQRLFKKVFGTEEGKIVLEFLKYKTDLSYIDIDNPNAMYVALGEQKLYKYIKQQTKES